MTQTNQPAEIQELGFDTWLELYEWVAEQGMQEQPKITLSWPEPAPGPDATVDVDAPVPTDKPDVTLSLNTIRANAFKEIYPQLPTKKTISIFVELLQQPELSRTEADTIRARLNNLPTKTSE